MNKKYLVLMKLGGQVSTSTLIKKVPAIKDAVHKLSFGKFKLFYTANDGSSFGFFVSTDIGSTKFISALRGHTNLLQTAVLDDSSDSVFISEVANDWSASGFSNGWSFLQNENL